MPTYTIRADSTQWGTLSSFGTYSTTTQVLNGTADTKDVLGYAQVSATNDPGIDGNGVQITQFAFRFDCSSITAGETISSVTLTLRPDYVDLDGRALSAVKYDWGSTVDTGDFRTPSQLAACSVYATKTFNTADQNTNVNLTLSGSTLATDVAARGTVRMLLVFTSNISGTFPDGALTFIDPSNGTVANRPTLTVVTTGGTTQTATTTGVSNSPTVAANSAATKPAIATVSASLASAAAASATKTAASTDPTSSPSTSAAASVVKAVDAAITTSPTSTASSSAAKSGAVSLTTTPTTTADASVSGAAKTGDVAVSSSPATTATGTRVISATATNVTVSPSTTSAGVRVVVADASTTTSPSSAASSAKTVSASAVYALTPFTAAAITLTHTLTAVGTTITVATVAVAAIGDQRGQMFAATKPMPTMAAAPRSTPTMTGA